jgi:uncharacterized protein (TIGR03000 family)
MGTLVSGLMLTLATPAFAQTSGYYILGGGKSGIQMYYGEPYPDYGGPWRYPYDYPSPYYPNYYRGYYRPAYYDYYTPPAQQIRTGIGKVTVRVPKDATVRFNDLDSPVGVPKRWFETPTLRGNQEFPVTIRAEWTEDGRKVERTRAVDLHIDENVNIDLTVKGGSSSSQEK